MYKATKNNQGVSRRTFLSSTAAAGVGTLAVELTSRSAEAATQIAAADISKLPRVKQELVAPPFAPKHDQVAKGGPKVVEITMVIKEKKMVLDDDGTEIWALTYDGWVPGPLVIVHEGDYVELTLINPESNAMEHNIDFHASTGALGGGGLTHVTPGEETVLRFKATKPGVFVYHCAPGGV
ncbi:MAG: multicopper oxidase domain-containing protein, partial [Rhodospirillales bacterium]|nr:multicopper oxidase domain-containing protein [Rhodospirillales bacterium]